MIILRGTGWADGSEAPHIMEAHQWLQVNKLYELADNKKEWNVALAIAPGRPCSHAEWSR